MEDVINSVKDVKTAINVLAYDVDSLKTLIPLVRQICSVCLPCSFVSYANPAFLQELTLYS